MNHRLDIFAYELPLSVLLCQAAETTMLIGYIDDSGSAESNLVTLSCLVSHGGMWQWIEWAWLNVLEKKNEELKVQERTPLSRYHAADCSFRYKEFKDWTVPEQIEFTEQLIRKVFRHPMSIISYTLDVRDLVAEFPEAKKNPFPLAQILLLNHIVEYIAEKVLADNRYLFDQIALIHEDLVQLRKQYPKLDMAEKVIRQFASPPHRPQDCVFALTTQTLSADLKTEITPCQFGGNPDCTSCGCVASMYLTAVAAHKLGGILPVGAIFKASIKIGQTRARYGGNRQTKDPPQIFASK
jgi:hypothetical protein